MSSGDTIKRHVIATDATVVRSYSRLRLRTITCTLHESAGVFNIKRGLTAIINDKITIVPVRGSRTFQRVRLDRVDRRQTVNSKLSAKGEKKHRPYTCDRKHVIQYYLSPLMFSIKLLVRGVVVKSVLLAMIKLCFKFVTS